MKNLNKHIIFMLLATLLFGAVLTACGGDPEPTPRPTRDRDEDEDEEENDPPPDEDPEEDPTDEPEPTEEPTSTPEPEPTPIPDPTAGFTDFSNDVLGIEFSYPSDWAIEANEEGSDISLASSQEILDSADDKIEGAIMNILLLPNESLGFLGGEGTDVTDPVAILTVFTDLISADPDTEFVLTLTDPPTAVTINGQDAAQAFADAVATDGSGDEAIVKLAIIMGDAQAAFLFSGSELGEEAANRATLDAIESSIVVSAPAGGAPETVAPPDSAGLLLYGDSVSGAAPSTWNFVGLEGEIVDIIVEPEGEFDVVFDVVDDSGNSVLPNGEVDASFGTEEVLGLTIPASGNYNIVVRGFADAVGNYQLSIGEAGTAVAPPVTGGEGEAIAYGSLVSGAVDSANPVASYSFAGATDDIVGMIITTDGEFDAVIDVVDGAGNSLLSRERDASFGNENVLVALPAEGVYTINVYGFEGSPGSFDLQLGFPLTNIVIAAPDTLDPEDEGEGHSFPFTALRAGDMVGIFAEPAEGLDIAIQVRQGDEFLAGLGFEGERGFDYSIDDEEFVMLIDETGTYTFRVKNSEDEDFGGNVGDYEVVLFGSTEVVFELAYGDFVDAQTNEDGLIDYVISGAVGDSMVINVVSDDDSVDMVIEVLNLDEEVLATIDDGFSGEAEELVYTFESEELVIIRVSDFFGGVGDFTMAVEKQ